jgi:O-antigen/teichoic acid export membrane protein
LAQTAKLALQVGLNLVFLIPLRMGPQAVLLSGLLANCALAPVLVTYLLREVPFRPSRHAARQLLGFGAPLIATQMAMFVVTYADRYFLQAAAGSAVVGLYALSYQFGFLLATLANAPFLMVWEPLRFEVAKRPDRDRIYARFFIYLSVVLMTLGTILALFVRDFLRVMAAPTFLHAADIVPLLLAAYAFHAWTNFHSIGILVRERTGFIALADWSAGIVALICYWLWIPSLLGLGAALATLVAYAVRWGIVYGVSQRLWPVRYEWSGVLQLAGAAGVVVGVGLLLPGETLAESLSARLAMFAVFGVALWCLPVFSEEERALLRRAGREPRVALGKLIG